VKAKEEKSQKNIKNHKIQCMKKIKNDQKLK
jgi:hypothetical protein